MSVEYTAYWKEIFNFLNSLTIKFSPFAKYMVETSANNGMVITNDLDNPYYINLAGLYSPLDEPMYVTDIETNKQVLFDIHLKDISPRTAAIYKIPSEEYNTLCLTYPKQQGLIKSIVYPGTSVKDVIAMEDFSIVNCDESLLYENERESIMSAINKFLWVVKERWFIRDYDYEVGYPLAFMGVVEALLPQVISTQRIRNIKTEQVHPLHIWEYLGSKGLGEYQDVLTNKQSLFMYRNIDYILQNKGKKSNLKILADNLLKDLKVQLVGKNILQQTVDTFFHQEIGDSGDQELVGVDNPKFQECQSTPEFINELIVNYSSMNTRDEGSFETMDKILFRVNEENLYPDYSADDSALMEDKFGYSMLNILPTRILEFRKYVLDTRYLAHMTEFIIDSLFYNFIKGTLDYTIKFTDTNTGVNMVLSIEDALLLWQYAHYRYLRQSPVVIQKLFTTRVPYVLQKPDMGIIKNDKFVFNNYSYRFDTIIDVDEIIKDVPFSKGPFKSANAFVKHLGDQFTARIKHTREVRSSANRRYQDCMLHFYSRYLVNHETLNINLTTHKNYQSWIESNERVKLLIDSTNELNNDPQYYHILCEQILSSLLPIETVDAFKSYSGALTDDTEFYAKIKQLFIRLCSKRLLFLDTDRTKYSYITKQSSSLFTEEASDLDAFAGSTSSDWFKMDTSETAHTSLAGSEYDLNFENYRIEESAEIDDFKELNQIELKQVSVKDSARHNLRQVKILKSYGEITDTSDVKLHIGCNLTAVEVL